VSSGLKSIAFVLVLAACGSPPASSTPQSKPAIRLVRCTAAIPPPQATGGGEVTRTTANDGQWSVSSKRDRIVVGPRASVTLGTVNIFTGPLKADEVAAVVRTKLGDFKACFLVEKATISKAATTFRMVVGYDGAVQLVSSTAQTLPGTLESCVRRTLQNTRFPAKGSSSTILVPLVFDSSGAFAMPAKPVDEAAPSEPWTPFAVGTTPVNPAAIGAARATAATIRTRLADLDKCFPSAATTGSLRILFQIDIAGELGGIRPGGFGDRAGEVCAAKALAGMRVMTPLQEHVEVACDFARGDAQPWRITPAAGYKVIDIDQTKLKHGADTLIPGASDPQPLPADTYVVLARSDTLGGMLQLALMWARDANAVLFAVADGKLSPLFLGMGNASSPAAVTDDVVRPAVRVGAKNAIGCVGRASHKASVTSSTELGNLMQRLATRCRTLHCTPTLVVAIDSDAVVRDLIEVAGAARRAGFERVLFGGAELGCSGDAKKKGVVVPEIEPDFE
jgi:hypothetical protein